MSSSSLKMNSKKEVELEGLAKNFVINNLSAAGVSYIFNSRSFIRRLVWFFVVVICVVFMGYMTVNVVLEYLSYPKMLIKEDIILPKLDFPAVTVCSLNPIASQFVRQTSLQKLVQLRQVLDKAKMEKPNNKYRESCYNNPLCQWSWFKETCNCVENPCLTEFCLSENITHCACSKIFCIGATEHASCKLVFLTQLSREDRVCICEGESSENSSITTPKRIDPDEEISASGNVCIIIKRLCRGQILELLSSIQIKDVEEIITLIKNSRAYDLVDVEEALMPSTEELYHYGTTFDSLIISCSFEGSYCHRENFTVLFHPNYGKCYMFNYVGKNLPGSEQPINTHSYGSTSGLQLLLRVADYNVLDLVRREIGARIVIHDPHSVPFVSEYGVNIRPHDMTAVELSMSKTHRLDAPWGDCVTQVNRDLNDEPYSILGCEKNCGLKYMMTLCNCTMRHLLRGTVLTSQPSSFPLCNFSNDTQRNCATKSSEDIDRHSEACKCRPPCSETIYSYTVTSSELNENYYRTVKAIHTLKLDEHDQMTYVNHSDEKSMLGVKVYYNTFMVSNQSEVASYSWETLVANVGGNLGFFMGLTLVTFFEITQFVYDLIRTACACNPESKVHTAQKTKKKCLFEQKTEDLEKRRQSF